MAKPRYYLPRRRRCQTPKQCNVRHSHYDNCIRSRTNTIQANDHLASRHWLARFVVIPCFPARSCSVSKGELIAIWEVHFSIQPIIQHLFETEKWSRVFYLEKESLFYSAFTRGSQACKPVSYKTAEIVFCSRVSIWFFEICFRYFLSVFIYKFILVLMK